MSAYPKCPPSYLSVLGFDDDGIFGKPKGTDMHLMSVNRLSEDSTLLSLRWAAEGAYDEFKYI